MGTAANLARLRKLMNDESYAKARELTPQGSDVLINCIVRCLSEGPASIWPGDDSEYDHMQRMAARLLYASGHSKSSFVFAAAVLERQHKGGKMLQGTIDLVEALMCHPAAADCPDPIAFGKAMLSMVHWFCDVNFDFDHNHYPMLRALKKIIDFKDGECKSVQNSVGCQ